MILHLGNKTTIRLKKIIGIFDMDTATRQKDTKVFIRKMEEIGEVNVVEDGELPKSFILEKNKLHISPIATQTLKKRIKKQY